MLKEIRAYLRKIGANALIVAHDDEYQNEILSPDKERLAYVTGFTGSAGLAIITPRQAVLFVDGRYVIQAKKQTKFKVIHVPRQTTVSEWLAKYVKENYIIAYDPWSHTVAQVDKWAEVCAKRNAKLWPCPQNPIDRFWVDRPRSPIVHVYSYPKEYAGKTTRQKVTPIKRILKEKEVDGFVVANPDTVSWLLNKRSDAVPFTPVYLGRCFVSASGKVQELTPDLFESFKGKVIGIDAYQTPVKIKQSLIEAGASIRLMQNPFSVSQGIKNKVEIEGMRKAAIKESIALCQFFCEMEDDFERYTELSILSKLEAFRKENEDYQGNSFAPISAVGAHAALPHYEPHSEKETSLKDAAIYLLDTGSQYLCGTTDVTRTIALKTPTELMKKRYTQVLKGHIQLARAIFPKGTSGAQLDALARQFLWQDDVDYDHGTGHGVGAFLNVHETPPAFSKYALEPLQENMVITNEPGFYLKNKFGIRIENMMTIQKYKKGMYHFEMLTFVPFCDELIDEKTLSEDEKNWLQMYYQNIFEKVYPFVNNQTQKWLEKKSLKWTHRHQ